MGLRGGARPVRSEHLLVNWAPHQTVLRLLPALNITDAELEEAAFGILEESVLGLKGLSPLAF